MKKIIAVLLTAILAVSLAACGKSGSHCIARYGT